MGLDIIQDNSDTKEQFDAKRSDPVSDDDDDDIVESDIELDDADVLEPDNDPPQKVTVFPFFFFFFYLCK